MLNKKTEKPAVTKNRAVSVKGIMLNASSARLGFIYAELLGPPVSKKRRIR